MGSRFEIPFTYDFVDGPEMADEDDVYKVSAATTGAISMIADFLVCVGGELAASRGRLRDGDAVVVTEAGVEIGATDVSL